MDQATLTDDLKIRKLTPLETSTNVSQGVKVEAKPAFGRFGQQAADTMNANEVSDFDIIEPFNHRVHKDQVSPTLTTRPEGLKTAILPVTNNLRIRKLTPLECWDFRASRMSNSTKHRRSIVIVNYTNRRATA